jgi:WXG100 family type VII secretion target
MWVFKAGTPLFFYKGRKLMPGTSNVETEKISTAASNLDDVVERMKGLVTKFAEAITSLDKGWVSEVKGSFMAAYNRDYEAMQEMIEQLREVNVTLREAAADFDKTENEINSIIRSLRR